MLFLIVLFTAEYSDIVIGMKSYSIWDQERKYRKGIAFCEYMFLANLQVIEIM